MMEQIVEVDPWPEGMSHTLCHRYLACYPFSGDVTSTVPISDFFLFRFVPYSPAPSADHLFVRFMTARVMLDMGAFCFSYFRPFSLEA